MDMDMEMEMEDGMALLPRVFGDTPLLRAGAPDVSKVDATVMISAAAGTELEILEEVYVDFNDIDIVPSKGNLYRNVNPADIAYVKGAVYNEDAFYPQSAAALQTPFVQRGVRGQSVWAFPFQYNPVTKVLRARMRAAGLVQRGAECCPDFWPAAEGKRFFSEDAATGRMMLYEEAEGGGPPLPVLRCDGAHLDSDMFARWTPQAADVDVQRMCY